MYNPAVSTAWQINCYISKGAVVFVYVVLTCLLLNLPFLLWKKKKEREKNGGGGVVCGGGRKNNPVPVVRYLQATGTIIINYKIIKTAASISSSFLLSGIIINILLIRPQQRRKGEKKNLI